MAKKKKNQEAEPESTTVPEMLADGIANSPELIDSENVEQPSEPEMVEVEIDCRGLAITPEIEGGEIQYAGCLGVGCSVCEGSLKEKTMVPAEQVPPPTETAVETESLTTPDAVLRMRTVTAPMDAESREEILQDILHAEEEAYSLEQERAAEQKSYKEQIGVQEKKIHDLCERLRAEGVRELPIREFIFWRLGKCVTVNGMTGEIMTERLLTNDDQPMTTDTPASYDMIPTAYRDMIFAPKEPDPMMETVPQENTVPDPVAAPKNWPGWMTRELADEIVEMVERDGFASEFLAITFQDNHPELNTGASVKDGLELYTQALALLSEPVEMDSGESIENAQQTEF